MSHGADIEACDGDGLRPIHVAAKTGRHVALIALLAAGADAWSLTPRKWNALHYSVAGGHLSTTRLLAFWDSDSGVFGRQTNSAGRTATDLTRHGWTRSFAAGAIHVQTWYSRECFVSIGAIYASLVPKKFCSRKRCSSHDLVSPRSKLEVLVGHA